MNCKPNHSNQWAPCFLCKKIDLIKLMSFHYYPLDIDYRIICWNKRFSLIENCLGRGSVEQRLILCLNNRPSLSKSTHTSERSWPSLLICSICCWELSLIWAIWRSIFNRKNKRQSPQHMSSYTALQKRN